MGILILFLDLQPLGPLTVTVILTVDPAGPPTLNLMALDPAPEVIVPLEIDQP